MIRLTVALLALLSTTSAGAAPSPDAPPAEPPAIVVRGMSAKAVDTYVRQMTDAQDGGQVSRWTSPLCPKVINLQPDLAKTIEDRILALASEAGAPTGAARCHANILLVFTATPDDAVKQIRQHYPDLFRFDTSGNRPAADYKALQQPRPVRWINGSDMLDANGVPLSESSTLLSGFGVPVTNSLSQASAIDASTTRSATLVIAIVDATRLHGVSTAQLADYLAFVALSRPRLGATFRGSTILALFDARDAQAALPAGITDQDRNFLAGLYASPTLRNGETQRVDIAYHMRHPECAKTSACPPADAKPK